MRIHDTIFVGCGGTGGYLAEPLTRLLTFHPKASGRVTFVDGDAYDDGNATRQVFAVADLGRNKAEATAERMTLAVPGCDVEAMPSYIDPLGALGLFANHTIRQQEAGEDAYLLCVTSVDNHATRKSLIQAADECGLNVILLSPGNGEDKGQVMSYVRLADGSSPQAHPFDRHPEIADPKDTMPGTCAQQAPSTPQLIGANMGAALVTLWTVQSWLDGLRLHDLTAFDTRTFAVRGTGNPLTLDGAAESVTA